MNGADWRDGDRVGVARLHWRSSRPAVAVCGLVVAMIGCSPHKRTNFDYCDPGARIECGDRRKVCDVPTRSCVFPTGGTVGTGGGAGGSGGRDGAGGGSGGGITDGGAGTGGKDATISCNTCSGATPICNSNTGACQRCSDNLQCATLDPAAPFCGTDGGQCLVCGADSDCARTMPAKPWCLQGRQCATCKTSADCRDVAPVCDGNHDCVACRMDNECSSRNPAVPACRTDGACVECTKHADCKVGTKPICAMNACVPCSTDKQCEEKHNSPDPGVCMSHTDGHCAENSEVWYVQPVSTCSDTATDAGTATKPFCKVETAIAAITATKSTLVLRPGTFMQPGWIYGGSPRVAELTVIGQAGATIGPALGVGITITAGNVYIRGLAVNGMQDSGVKVSSAGETTLRMNRCLITGNAGGLFVNGAGFDISNTVFALNRAAPIPPSPGGPAREYGGAYLGGVAGRPMVFRYNTVYRNAGPGVVCASAYLVKGLLVTENTNQEVVDCAIDATSEVPIGTTSPYDPKFDTGRPYRLTRLSSCVEKGTKGADSPPDDIDGNPRPSPSGGISDCGAHEFQQ